MKLKSVLRSLSRDSLRKIMGFWEIPGPATEEPTPAPGEDDFLVDYLYPRIQQRHHFDVAFGKLETTERKLVQFLTMHGGDLEKTEILGRQFKGDEEAMDDLVAGLSTKGFVFYDKIVEEPEAPLMVGLPEPYLRFIELPAYWEGYLGFFLRNLSNQALRALAVQGLRLPVESTRKDYILNEVRNHLLTPRTLRQHIDRLSEDQRMLFQMLIECKGVCLYRDLLDMGFQKRSDHSKADHINTLLQNSGLVFTAVPGANKYSNLLMVPRDIYYIATHHFQPDRRSLDELDSVSATSAERGPGIILDNSSTLLRDLVIFAAWINRMNVRPLANGGIGKNDLKKVLPKLSRHKSLKYCEFMALFLIAKKFLVSAGESFRVSNPFLNWLENSENAYEQIVSWWYSSPEWNEEFIEGNLAHTDFPPAGMINIQEFRRIVTRNAVELPADRWCSFDGFAEALNPQIEAHIPRRGTFSPERHNRSNDLITESIIAESLHWLGLVSVGLQDPKDLELIGVRTGNGRTTALSGRRGRPKKQKAATFVFQLTDIGRHVLGHIARGEPAFVPPPPGEGSDPFAMMRCEAAEIIVQPNLDVIAPPDLKLIKFFHLNEFSDVRSIDVMSTLQIHRESLRSGMDHGLHAEDITKFLRDATRGRVPEGITHLVHETSEKHGEVNMGFAGGYIIVDDPILLEEIKANKKMLSSIKDIVDNRLVLINPDVNMRKLARELQKIGFMPRLASEHVHIVSEDTFHLSLTKEDMYTLFAALRFVLAIEESIGSNLTEDKIAPLKERLKPDARVFYSLNQLSDSLMKTWLKNYEDATRTQIEELKNKYKTQLSRIVSAAQPRRSTKYSFKGPNPAKDKADIVSMIEFAIENEFELDIDYVKADGSEISEIVKPESLEHEKLYAHAKARDTYAVYRITRILKAKLI